MKHVSTALLAAGFLALGACGGGSEDNLAANTAGEDLYNVQDLSLDNELGDDLGNAGLGNETGLGNEAGVGNSGDTANLTDTNTTGNSQ